MADTREPSTTDIDAIRALVPMRSYEGPWYVELDEDGWWLVGYPTNNPLAGLIAKVPDYGDLLARFIAATRTAVPALLAEVDRLRTRLAAAEQVATLVGWCASRDHSERGKAATQAWMDWANAYGAPERDEAWDERIRELARRRDEIRAHTLAAIAREIGSDVPMVLDGKGGADE